MDNNPSLNPGIEVPFWLNNTQKWISGINSTTSCSDVIKALLSASGRLKDTDSLDKFVLVERWRRVERPLKKDSSLLKIYSAWGEEAAEVQFILKRVSNRRPERRRVRRVNSKLVKQLAQLESRHPRHTSDTESEVSSFQDNVQGLLKIIINQRETIQHQLHNLKAKDFYLKSLDRSFSCLDGREYVLRNYLDQIPEHSEETGEDEEDEEEDGEVEGREEESQDSGCGSGNDTQDSSNEALSPNPNLEKPLIVSENPGFSSTNNLPSYTDRTDKEDKLFGHQDHQDRSLGALDHDEKSLGALESLFEKLFHLNRKLEIQEEDVFRLTVQMETILASEHTTNLNPEQEMLLEQELCVAQEELDCMARLNSRLGYEIKRNELALTNMIRNYEGRRQFAERLENENIRQPRDLEEDKDRGLRRIVEESEYEVEEEEEDGESENEEKEFVRFEDSDKLELFPVLDPPQEFQNCLSPSAIYDMTSGYESSQVRYMENRFPLNYEKPVIRASVASPAYSQDSMSSQMTSSSATEKSVRFSDRDYILSTPEPQPYSREGGRDSSETGSRVKGILKCDGRVPDVTSFMLDNEDGTLV